MGSTPFLCQKWQSVAKEACHLSCGNCTVISESIYSECLALLSGSLALQAAKIYCSEAQQTFAQSRCMSAAVDQVQACYTPKAKACNAICGNYKGCDCVRQRKVYGFPDVCIGTTILTGQVPGSKFLQSCSLIPQMCKNDWPGTECGLYRHCPVDLCVVKNVTCVATNGCRSNGVCSPSDGQCYFSNAPDGTRCENGTSYTFNAHCIQGECIGQIDICLRDNVTCGTFNQCEVGTSKVQRSCDPTTGTCVFEEVPDGQMCTSLAQAGRCSGGICRRFQTNPCATMNCSWPGPCYEPPFDCNSTTGQCNHYEKGEGAPCDDGQASTFGDYCVEGKCLGDLVSHPQFQSYPGPCPGNVAGVPKSVQRYSGDTASVADCQLQCATDVACVALSWAFHVCSIYSRITRTRPPSKAFWGRQWVLEDAEEVDQLLNLASSGQFGVYTETCWVKGVAGDPAPPPPELPSLLGLALGLFAALPVLFAITSSWQSIIRCLCGSTGQGVGRSLSKRGAMSEPSDEQRSGNPAFAASTVAVKWNEQVDIMDDPADTYLQDFKDEKSYISDVQVEVDSIANCAEIRPELPDDESSTNVPDVETSLMETVPSAPESREPSHTDTFTLREGSMRDPRGEVDNWSVASFGDEGP